VTEEGQFVRNVCQQLSITGESAASAARLGRSLDDEQTTIRFVGVTQGVVNEHVDRSGESFKIWLAPATSPPEAARAPWAGGGLIHLEVQTTFCDLQNPCRTFMSLPATIPCFGYDAAHFELTPLVFELARLEVGPRTRRAFAHRHSYCHLLWITAGQGVHMIDFEAYRLCPHALFFIAPRQVHHWVAETPVAGYSLKFSLEFLDQVVAASAALAGFPFERSRQAPAAYLTPEQAADVLPLIEQLTDEIAGESAAQAPHCHEMLAVLLRLLLLRLARLLPTPATGAPATPPPDVARRFFALLETHLLVLNKASDYAELLQSNVGRLDEALKRASGRTAAQLIRDRLLLEAKRRLMFTCQPVAELAFELGFADPAYFGRFFRQRTQLSPGDFRRRHERMGSEKYQPPPVSS